MFSIDLTPKLIMFAFIPHNDTVVHYHLIVDESEWWEADLQQYARIFGATIIETQARDIPPSIETTLYGSDIATRFNAVPGSVRSRWTTVDAFAKLDEIIELIHDDYC